MEEVKLSIVNRVCQETKGVPLMRDKSHIFRIILLARRAHFPAR